MQILYLSNSDIKNKLSYVDLCKVNSVRYPGFKFLTVKLARAKQISGLSIERWGFKSIPANLAIMNSDHTLWVRRSDSGPPSKVKTKKSQ